MLMRSRFRRTPAMLAGAAAACLALPALAQSDSCGSATLITPGVYSGTTAGATNDGSASCASSSASPDVWYGITPAENGVLVANTCAAAGYDTALSIHSGCPGTTANQLACDDDGCGSLRSQVQTQVEAGQTYYIRVTGYNGNSGSFTLTVALQEPPPPGSGPDLTYSGVSGVAAYGPVGGTVAYALGTNTCNIGNQNLLWTSGGTPGVGFNAYRLHDGRIVQLGQSWAKVACCAAAGNGCGLPCNGNGGSVLGAGCLDVYGASYNGGHGQLRPRSMINPWTGQFLGTLAGPTGTLDRRCQVQTADLSSANFPGALYFVEGVYVADDESQVPGPTGHHPKMNNASSRRITVSGTTLTLVDGTQVGIPAIQAWRDHGLGLNTPDPDVVVQQVDVPDEGRFWVAHTVRDNGNGTWRYEYAVFNLNSHVSGGSFGVPLPEGVTATNIGFHDVDYHSGEPYDNSDWAVETAAGVLRWRSPQTFAQNPNSNALRWGTMYNFWFDADTAPADGQATLGLFRPHTPDSVAFSAAVPGAIGGGGCSTDWNGDEAVNSTDISAFLAAWIASVNGGTLDADFNADLTVNSTDISAFLGAWIDEVTGGC